MPRRSPSASIRWQRDLPRRSLRAVEQDQRCEDIQTRTRAAGASRPCSRRSLDGSATSRRRCASGRRCLRWRGSESASCAAAALALDDGQERRGDARFLAKEQSWRTARRARSLLSRTAMKEGLLGDRLGLVIAERVRGGPFSCCTLGWICVDVGSRSVCSMSGAGWWPRRRRRRMRTACAVWPIASVGIAGRCGR